MVTTTMVVSVVVIFSFLAVKMVEMVHPFTTSNKIK